MARYGPTYLFLGSRLSDDTYMLRMVLEGLNRWAFEWQETLVIADNGSLDNLEREVGMFKNLEHRKVSELKNPRPNMVIGFLDRLSHNRETERWIRAARQLGIPAFVISTID
jgi:hypothetical protein